MPARPPRSTEAIPKIERRAHVAPISCGEWPKVRPKDTLGRLEGADLAGKILEKADMHGVLHVLVTLGEEALDCGKGSRQIRTVATLGKVRDMSREL